jgi:hypothetical protein
MTRYALLSGSDVDWANACVPRVPPGRMTKAHATASALTHIECFIARSHFGAPDYKPKTSHGHCMWNR